MFYESHSQSERGIFGVSCCLSLNFKTIIRSKLRCQEPGIVLE